jgi:hypothetical protein
VPAARCTGGRGLSGLPCSAPSSTSARCGSTADPSDLLDEGGHAIDPARETNNTTITYFTVSGGQIGNVRNSP